MGVHPALTVHACMRRRYFLPVGQTNPFPLSDKRTSIGTPAAFVIHPEVRTMPMARSADAMLAEAAQLVGP